MGRSLLTGRGDELLGARHREHGDPRRSSARRSQQEQWLRPLLDGEIRSCFAMTEPWVASSRRDEHPSRIERDGDDYVINAHKWWTSGAASTRVQGRDPHGRLGSRRRPVPPPLDDPRADGRAGRAGRAHAARVRPRRRRRPLRDAVRGRPRARPRTCSARRAAGSRSRRPASARAASTTACARSAWPRRRSS